MKVLIVEDMDGVRRQIVAALAALGHTTTEAEDGKEALKVLQKQKINFVITDWNMPNMDGIGLIQSIRKSKKESIRSVPILMLSAGIQPGEKMDQALLAGADRCAEKVAAMGSLEKEIRYTMAAVAHRR